uniref:Exostosin GT47 domain-containing protein n=1 Tax=Chromera velia CCMP2878 TaxID=1169474 RepID=A0A0G4HRE6_9ALVE|eukprot:Cvel_8057.t1-p1 / transcript=Cvel_8057.t1 / gene=Cvel_8057 / organism=Chromera_velia_CCMP2878 / gene_product=hypothetical protein / transcript_product=hypothetical protein / location=Cvel_scaffold436:16862-18088(+) / protein_length=409 / sequence_SO=supercontig / SO=protein_coding / is_pseudo=false
MTRKSVLQDLLGRLLSLCRRKQCNLVSKKFRQCPQKCFECAFRHWVIVLIVIPSLVVLFRWWVFLTSPTRYEDWVPTYFVWNRGMALEADVHFDEHYDPRPDFQSVFRRMQSPPLFYVFPLKLSWFAREILPRLERPIILLSAGHLGMVPTEFLLPSETEQILRHPKIIRWWAQNSEHPEITNVPIGVDFASRASGPGWFRSVRLDRYLLYNVFTNPFEPVALPFQQEAELQELLKTLKPTGERQLGVYADFHFQVRTRRKFRSLVRTSRPFYNETEAQSLPRTPEREEIFELIQNNPLVHITKGRLPRLKTWKEKGQFAFEISPPGFGLDCHRTWEALVLGLIVLVPESAIDDVFESLPVVFVKNWTTELTEENLRRWRDKHANAFHNPEVRERLKLQWWIHRMRTET